METKITLFFQDTFVKLLLYAVLKKPITADSSCGGSSSIFFFAMSAPLLESCLDRNTDFAGFDERFLFLV